MRHPTVPHSIGVSLLLAIGVFAASLSGIGGQPAEAREGNKTLKLYFGHTKEKGEFTFSRNGRYDRRELARINHFLRDWRKNEDAKLDPKLLDLVYAIYRETGSREYIHVVSAYRSLTTNNMLRSRSKGVAKTSQHTAGKAMDFYIPGVPLATLRATAMKLQGGGVGYYPTSGSPFVHVDTGNVRSWPRMSRKQLLALFPNGETLYLPADGKPLPGYERAQARRRSSGGTALAYVDSGEQSGGKGTVGGWLKRVFDGGADEAEDTETAAAPAPAAPPADAPAGSPAVAPAAEEVVPAPAEPAGGEPTVLVASTEGADDTRLPRARPPTEAEIAVASAMPLLPTVPAVPAVTVPAAPAATETATLAFAPLPRNRPDLALLSGTLEAGASAPAALAVPPEDAIAALTQRSQTTQATDPGQKAAPLQVAVAPQPARPLAAGETAIGAANALAAKAPGAPPPPRSRPVALAFAGAGLDTADPVPAPADVTSVALAAPAASAASPRPAPIGAADLAAQVAAKGDRMTIAALAAQELPPAYDADQGDLRHLIVQDPAPPPVQAEGFTMPEPTSVDGFFSAPATASGVTEIAKQTSPPVNGFRLSAAEQTPPPGESGSFFAKLFSSLTR